MDKIEIPLSKANRLINFGPVVLISMQAGSKKNIVPIAWATAVSHKPPVVGVAIAKAHFSSEIIKQSKEFTLNVPEKHLVPKVIYCGSISGKNVDKFSETGLTAVTGKKIKAPSIDECSAHLECKVINIVETGDHNLFIGEVLYASAKSDFLDANYVVNLENICTLHHLGGDKFATLKPV